PLPARHVRAALRGGFGDPAVDEHRPPLPRGRPPRARPRARPLPRPPRGRPRRLGRDPRRDRPTLGGDAPARGRQNGSGSSEWMTNSFTYVSSISHTSSTPGGNQQKSPAASSYGSPPGGRHVTRPARK